MVNASPEHMLLAGVLADGTGYDRLTSAIARGTPGHLADDRVRPLFTVLVNYHSQYGGVPGLAIVEQAVAKVCPDEEKRNNHLSLVRQCAEKSVPEDQFLWALDEVRDRWLERERGACLDQAVRVHHGDAQIVDGESLSGHEVAARYVRSQYDRIDADAGYTQVDAGYLDDELHEVVTDYEAAATGAGPQGVLMGIEAVDTLTGGFHGGELILLYGGTGEGKSMLVTQTAWHAAVMQDKNVLFLTNETPKKQVRLRYISRHSRLPSLGINGGIDAWKIRNGKLDPEEREALYTVLDNVVSGTREGRYGRLSLVQLPGGATMREIRSTAHAISAKTSLDLVVIDHLMYLSPERPRSTRREELAETLRAARELAGSIGVPVLSPWHVNREGDKRAKEGGDRQLSDAAECAEAERLADLVLSIRPGPDPHTLALEILKNRDGAMMDRPVTINCDFRSSSFWVPAGVNAMSLLED